MSEVQSADATITTHQRSDDGLLRVHRLPLRQVRSLDEPEEASQEAMSDPLLPSDVSEQAVDPVVCEQCQISEGKIEDLQDALSDALAFLVCLEDMTRHWEFGNVTEQQDRKDLLACIERVKKLG